MSKRSDRGNEARAVAECFEWDDQKFADWLDQRIEIPSDIFVELRRRVDAIKIPGLYDRAAQKFTQLTRDMKMQKGMVQF